MFRTFLARFSSRRETPPCITPHTEKQRTRLHPEWFQAFHHTPAPSPETPLANYLKPYTPPPGVRSTGLPSAPLAMDSTTQRLTSWASLYGDVTALDQLTAEGTGFLGYPLLAALSQRAEFRKPCDVIAREATREWITLRLKPNPEMTLSPGKAAHLCEEVASEMKRLHVREIIRGMIEQALTYGLSHIHVDVSTAGSTPDGQGLPLLRNCHSFSIGSLKRFRLLEPVWTTPDSYNSDNPLADDYYRPSLWWVQGIRVHHSRLVSMVPYEVSDLFKPAFNFGGLSLIQQMLPYIRNFLRIRSSVTNITTNFSKLVLKTSLAGNMQGTDGLDYADLSAASLQGRAALLHDLSDGQDTIIADKEAEDVSVISTPLNGLGDLQSQAMEAIASVPGIPLVKLFGIQPAGLNASSDGELRVFYDEISAFQKAHLAPVLHQLLELIQLNLWGEINPALDFDFVPLWQMDAEQAATIEKTKAEIDDLNIHSGKITPQEARSREATDAQSLYRHVALNSETP